MLTWVKMKKTYFLEDTLQSETYHLLAIHTTLEDYQLAFEINRLTGSQFKRTKKDIDLPQKNAFFARFKWIDNKTEQEYDFFTNKYLNVIQNNDLKKNTLFEQPIVKEVYLIPEFKTINFFIKTNNLDNLSLLKIKLKQLNSLIMVYTLPPLKTRNQLNLIFD